MNHMKDVAKLLGVELGEEFKIKHDGCETSSNDLALYKLGKLYRIKAEAEAHAAEDKAFWDAEDKAFWDEIRKDLEE